MLCCPAPPVSAFVPSPSAWDGRDLLTLRLLLCRCLFSFLFFFLVLLRSRCFHRLLLPPFDALEELLDEEETAGCVRRLHSAL